MSLRDAVTYRALLAWLAGGFVAAVIGSLTFGSSVVSRAEAAASVQVRGAEIQAADAKRELADLKVEVRDSLREIKQNGQRVEAKVDRILERDR